MLEQELQNELGPNHALKFSKPRLIARRLDSDEALFELDGGHIAQVHLTRTSRPEPDPRCPATSFFGNLEEWRRSWESETE